MKIKKKFQGSLPENAILNTASNSETDTYSCKYINEKFMKKEKTDWITLATNLKCRKVGTNVEVSSSVPLSSVTMSNGLWVTLGTLPEGYRTSLDYIPFPVILRNASDQSYLMGLGHILPDGTIRASQRGNGNITVDSVTFFISYSV